MSIGQFILRRFNGDEIYRLHQPTMWADTDEDGVVVLSFEAPTAKEPLASLPDSVGLCAHPRATACVRLSSLSPGALVGTRLRVPLGYDPATEADLASLYYCEHEDLDENEITVVSRFKETLRIRWTGQACDVVHYDQSKPRTRVEIDGFFRFRSIEDWEG